VESYALTGKTPVDERDHIIAKMATAGHTENVVTTTCMVLTEGWDCPDLRQIVLARPTQSPLVYMQQLGRGTRTAPGKKAIIVLDIQDNYRKSGLCNCLSTVFGLRPDIQIEGNVTQELAEREEKKEKDEAGSQPANTTASERVSLVLEELLFTMPIELERSKLAWFSPDEGVFTVQVDNGKYWEIRENALRYDLYGCNPTGKKLLAQSADIVELEKQASEMTEKWWPHNAYMWNKRKRADWSAQPVTEKQKNLLRRIDARINPQIISKATASEIIRAWIAKKEQKRRLAK
jgi:type I site-specific restriction endonuclease